MNNLSHTLNRYFILFIYDLTRILYKLIKKGILKEFKSEAFNTIVYLLNRFPTKVVWNVTHFKAWNWRNPSVNQFKVFGCIWYALVTKVNRKNLKNQVTNASLLAIALCEKDIDFTIWSSKKWLLAEILY